jgi:hypothetical protein
MKRAGENSESPARVVFASWGGENIARRVTAPQKSHGSLRTRGFRRVATNLECARCRDSSDKSYADGNGFRPGCTRERPCVRPAYKD